MLTALICLSITTTLLLGWATSCAIITCTYKEDLYNQRAEQRKQTDRHNSELHTVHASLIKYKELFIRHRDKSTALRQRIFEMKKKYGN